MNISSRQLSLSNFSKESEDRNGMEQLAEEDKQNRTDDLESVLNNTPAMRKYNIKRIIRRKSLTSSIKL